MASRFDSSTTTGRPNFRGLQRSQARRGTSKPPWADKPKEESLYPPDWEAISQAIRRRDGYRCKVETVSPGRKCKAYFPPPFSQYLHVHHIVPLPRGSNKPNNLITLCKECHGFVHGRDFGKISHKARSAAAKW